MTIEMTVRPIAGKAAASEAGISPRAATGQVNDSSSGFTSALADAEAASPAPSSKSADEEQTARNEKDDVAVGSVVQDRLLPLSAAEQLTPLEASGLDLRLSEAPSNLFPGALSASVIEAGDAAQGLGLLSEVPMTLSESSLVPSGGIPNAGASDGVAPQLALGLAGELGGLAKRLAPSRLDTVARQVQPPTPDGESLAADIKGIRLKVAVTNGGEMDGDTAAVVVALDPKDARAIERGMPDLRKSLEQEAMRPVAAAQMTPTVESGFRREFKSEKAIFRSDGVALNDAFNLSKGDLGMVRMGGAAADTQMGSTGYAPQQSEAGKYWISGDLKNAEMKLDGLGDSPVEVSISMIGKEAHVSFRSDESQTRTLLENANVELSELLGKEGLQLSGVSVGAKGSGDSGLSDQRPRNAFKPLVDLKEFADRVETSGRWTSGSGQAVDLFV